MGMKLKSGADLCGFQLTNFCIQGEASAPSDAALGRKYFHTNATDDVATGISLLHRERIYLGEGAWRATAYLDDIAAINEKLNLITGDTDTDTLINNLKDLEEFLKDFSETDKLKSLLDGKLDKSGGTITSTASIPLTINSTSAYNTLISFHRSGSEKARMGHTAGVGAHLTNMVGGGVLKITDAGALMFNDDTLLHSGNIGSQKVAGLATPVTIWGQSFDGTGNVSGDLKLGYSVIRGANNESVAEVTANDLTLGYSYRNLSTVIYGGNIFFAKDDAYTMLINASGNVTIGDSDFAGTSAKLYVNGKAIYRDAILADRYNGQGNTAGASLIINKGDDFFGFGPSATDKRVMSFGSVSDTSGTWKTEMVSIYQNGNVLIGTTTDSGEKLQVVGSASFRSATSWQNERAVLNYAGLKLYARDTGGYNQSISFLHYDGTIFAGLFAAGRRSLVVGTAQDAPWVTFAPDGVHITGNLIVDGEVSAGGAGAEEGTSGSGSAEGVSEVFTPTSTSMAFDHHLGEDVIVQVYEKSGNVWNMVMVDTEITSATRVTLRFGKTETTQHKVVIMGV